MHPRATDLLFGLFVYFCVCFCFCSAGPRHAVGQGVGVFQEERASVRMWDVLGAVLPAAPAPALGAPPPPPQTCPAASLRAQKVIHGIFAECNDVFASQSCFTVIDDGKACHQLMM